MRRLALALLAAAACAPAAHADLVSRGRDLYHQGCIECHGIGAQGVERKGPSLHGVGAAAADLYLSAGYMPLRSPHERPTRRPPFYSPDDIRALVAYIGSLGGPAVPHPDPSRGSLAEGMRLYTEYCAGCHQIAARGGVVTGAIPPSLSFATPAQVAEAVRVGPYLMPRFPKDVISNDELNSIVAYVELTKHPVNRGGWSLRNLGPVPEGLVAWLIAGTALVVLARVIGERR